MLLFLLFWVFLSFSAPTFSMELSKDTVSADRQSVTSSGLSITKKRLSFEFLFNSLPREQRKIMKEALREAIRLSDSAAQNYNFEVIIQGLKIVRDLFPQIHKIRFGTATFQATTIDEHTSLQPLYLQDKQDVSMESKQFELSDEHVFDIQKIIDELEALSGNVNDEKIRLDEYRAQQLSDQEQVARILAEGEETKKQNDRTAAETRANIESLKSNQEQLGMRAAAMEERIETLDSLVEKSIADLDALKKDSGETKSAQDKLNARVESIVHEAKEQKESLDKQMAALKAEQEVLRKALEDGEKKREELERRTTRNWWIGLGAGAFIALGITSISFYAYNNLRKKALLEYVYSLIGRQPTTDSSTVLDTIAALKEQVGNLSFRLLQEVTGSGRNRHGGAWRSVREVLRISTAEAVYTIPIPTTDHFETVY